MQSSSNDTNSGTLGDMLWGFSLELLDKAGVVLMFIGAGLGVLALLVSLGSAYVLYKVADEAQKALGKETQSSAERVAELNNQTARLTADNLALQTVLEPRHVGLIGIDERPKAAEWFAGMEAFSNTEFIVVSIDDSEARNLANEIVAVLKLFGLNAKVDVNRTAGGAARIGDGVSVSYPIGRAWTAQQPNQPWFEWAKAANALADALTKAGLGVGSIPVQRYGFQPLPPSANVSFDPVREGVLVLIGSRPVAATVAWIKSGRRDAAGNPPQDTPRQ